MLLNIGQIKKKRCYGCPYPITLFLLLPNEESNLAPQNQNLMYYRYTIRQSDLFLVSKGLTKVVSLDRNRLQKYCVFLIYQNFFDFFCIFLSFSIGSHVLPDTLFCAKRLSIRLRRQDIYN